MTDAQITPALSMGQRPDGTAWVVHVDFGSEVAVDGWGRLVLGRKYVSPAEARAKAEALLAAAEWIETGRSAGVERQHDNGKDCPR